MRYRIKDKQQVIDWFNNFADWVESQDEDLWKSLDNIGQDKVGLTNNT